MASEINIGTPVFSSDDSNLGDVDQLIVDVANKVVVSLIIDKSIFGPGKIVDIDSVAQASDKGVVLSLTKDEAEALPEYFEREMVQFRDASTYVGGGMSVPLGGTGADWMLVEGGGGGTPQTGGGSLMAMPITGEIVTRTVSSVPAEYVFIDKSTNVVDSNFDKMGRVDIVTFSEGNKVGSFTMKAGHVFHKDFRIPVEWIAGASHDHVRLTMSKSEFEAQAEQI